MKLVKEFEVNGLKFLIQCHPFAEGAVIAFQLNRDLRSHVIESQKATMRALDDLTPEQTKRLEDAKDNDERTKIWIEIVAPKISKEDLAQSAVNFLKSINPKEMVSLFSDMAKYTKSADGKPLGELTDTILSANRGLGSMVDNFVGLSAKAEDGALAVTMFDRATGKTTTKKVQSGDKAGIMDFFTQAAERKGIKGGMGELSKTLTGQMSTLTDSAKNLATVFSGGFIDKVHKLLEGTIKQLDKMEPQFKSMGEMAGKFINDMPKMFKDAQPYIEGCAAALVGMVVSYGAMQAMALAKWLGDMALMWRAMDGAMKAAAISGGIANLTIGWLPMLIGAAVAAVAWFGWQVYKYITQGTDSLTWMNENFKWLSDAIMLTGEVFKTWWPIIEYTGKVITGVLILAWQGLLTIIQFGWDNIIKPIFDKFIKSLSDIWNWIKSVTIESDNWNAGVSALWEGWKGFLNWLQPILTWVSETMGGIGGAVKSWTDALSNLPSLPGFGGGTDGGGATTGGGAGYDPVFGGKAAQMARQTAAAMNTVNRCAEGFEISFKKMTGIAITGHAYQVKQQMDRNKLYRQVQVTDEEMKNLPPGYVVVHDRNLSYTGPGLGGKYGHVSMSLGNGMEASDHIQKQMVNHYAGGKRYVYMPIGNGGGGGGSTPVVNVNVNVGGSNASPKQIGDAAGKGTGKALNQAKQQQRKPVTPGKLGAVLG